MKWITCDNPRADQAACSWLIKNFIDKNADFIFVSADQVTREAARLGATPYAAPDVELGSHGEESAFEAIVKKYDLTADPALMLLDKIVGGVQAEGAGLKAIAEGFQHLNFKDDDALIRAEWIVFDALYGYCIHSIIQGKPDGMFK